MHYSKKKKIGNIFVAIFWFIVLYAIPNYNINYGVGPLYWPMFVVAVMASIIASQAMISGTFAIIQQSLSLGCFPLVKIVHTSSKYEGQVYIPEINYLLMLACVAVTIGFRTTQKIGNAYGMSPHLIAYVQSFPNVDLGKTHNNLERSSEKIPCL